MQPKTTWIVVANAGSARIIACTQALEHPELVEEFDHPESRMMASDLVTDDHGREGPRRRDAARSGKLDPSTPVREVEAGRFGLELAEFLRLRLARHEYDALVLTASPRFLGRLRSAMDPQVARITRLELDRDYTRERMPDVVDRVRDGLPQQL